MAQVLLQSGCSWGSGLMSADSLQEATHRPPDDWDPVAHGPWECRHCRKPVWQSWAEVRALEGRLAKLRSAVANDDEAAEKELDALLSAHAETHLDMILLAKLPIRAGTGIFIVDLLHALNLNVAKTAWKYSYGDRMLEKQRLQAARHLNAIGIPLDVRAKGKRNPDQKWFSSAQFDEFVLGTALHAKSKSPGLAENTWAMVDIVFQPTAASTAAVAPPAATPAQPAPPPPVSQPKPPSQSRQKRAAPAAGFTASAPSAPSPAAPPPPPTPPTETVELPEHLQRRTDAAGRSEMRGFAQKRFGSRAAEAINVLLLWSCFGDLYAAAKDPWPNHTQEYRAHRAVRFLRAGQSALPSHTHISAPADTRPSRPVAAVAFGTVLNSVSDYKHKSWYVHYLIWIVPRMIYIYGDLWRFCTAAIESRGARLKRMGRTVICWRPYQEGKSVYHYIDHRTGQEVTREQSYKSSPMEQMLSKMLAQEVAWHSDSVFVRPAKLRLQQELRRRRLKCEFEHEVGPDHGMGHMGLWYCVLDTARAV